MLLGQYVNSPLWQIMCHTILPSASSTAKECRKRSTTTDQSAWLTPLGAALESKLGFRSACRFTVSPLLTMGSFFLLNKNYIKRFFAQGWSKFWVCTLECNDCAFDEEHGAGCDLVPGRSERQVEPDFLFLSHRRPGPGLEEYICWRKRARWKWSGVSIWHRTGCFFKSRE